MRIPLASTIRARKSTTDKGARLLNAYADIKGEPGKGGISRVIKRPALASVYEATPGVGQLLFTIETPTDPDDTEETLVVITDDTVTTTPVAGGYSLSFQVQPSDVDADEIMAPDVVVRVLTRFGLVATSYIGDVTLSLYDNPSEAELSGTTTVSAVSGVATFSDLTIDRAGEDYTLLAEAPNVRRRLSDPFNVVAYLDILMHVGDDVYTTFDFEGVRGSNIDLSETAAAGMLPMGNAGTLVVFCDASLTNFVSVEITTGEVLATATATEIAGVPTGLIVGPGFATLDDEIPFFQSPTVAPTNQVLGTLQPSTLTALFTEDSDTEITVTAAQMAEPWRYMASEGVMWIWVSTILDEGADVFRPGFYTMLYDGTVTQRFYEDELDSYDANMAAAPTGVLFPLTHVRAVSGGVRRYSAIGELTHILDFFVSFSGFFQAGYTLGHLVLVDREVDGTINAAHFSVPSYTKTDLSEALAGMDPRGRLLILT